MGFNKTPSIAVYGASQVGKSYLIANLLRKSDGTPFSVAGIDFIHEINPITWGSRATGIVTRFSSFSRNAELYSPEYPIIMRTLSVRDTILTLCEGYYHFLDDYSIPENTQIIAEDIYQRYLCEPVVPNSPLLAEDMLEMKSYFKKHIKAVQTFTNGNFFDKVALVADRIPIADYADVFSYLWNRDTTFTEFFAQILDVLSRLSFSRYLYLPVEAFLHKGDNNNSIISVECLWNLDNKSDSSFTDVMLRSSIHTQIADHDTHSCFTKISGVCKCLLCAACAEAIFHVDEDTVNSSSCYSFDDIPEESASKLTHLPIKKSFLRKMDILDFPGSSYLGFFRKSLSENKVLLNSIFFFSKNHYLFNKYNDDDTQNVLLYCHDYKPNAVKSIPYAIQEWVLNHVGDTPEKRAENIRSRGGIPPLFIVSTKFNVDMSESQNHFANEPTAILSRWVYRFTKALYKECLYADCCSDAANKSWVKDWTGDGIHFQNCFLLRDIKYSGEKGSRLYQGFATEGRETNRIISDEFYNSLRNSFCESSDVKFFFNDPALAWDVAASRNNDGTLYLIEKLSHLAEKL